MYTEILIIVFVCFCVRTLHRKFLEAAPEICKEIQEQVSTAMSLSICMGIGCYVDSLEDLPKSYEMAAEVLKLLQQRNRRDHRL